MHRILDVQLDSMQVYAEANLSSVNQLALIPAKHTLDSTIHFGSFQPTEGVLVTKMNFESPPAHVLLTPPSFCVFVYMLFCFC